VQRRRDETSGRVEIGFVGDMANIKGERAFGVLSETMPQVG